MKHQIPFATAVRSLAIALTILVTGKLAHAQNDRIILPPPRPPIVNQELQLVSQQASVEINGGAAHTKLTQTFQNVTGRTIEGTYVFPLPEGAAVNGFAMTVNGKRMEAEILEGDKARGIYTGIVQKLRDPAILEFIDRNLIRARIFPIPPNSEQKVELTYSEALKPESNSFRYVLPLRLPVGGTAQRASVDIRIAAPNGIRAVYSPTHAVQVTHDNNVAHVTGEFNTEPRVIAYEDRAVRADGKGDRDFVLYYTTATTRVGVNLVTYRTGEDDGYFMLLAAPDSAVAPKEIAAKDVVFVCDTSGSMEGEKIDQAKRALGTLINNLNLDDQFNLITFSSDVRPLNDGLVPASKKNIDAARDFVHEIKAIGGTDINDALTTALQAFKNDGRPHQLVFMTDGEPTVGVTDSTQILKNVRDLNDAKNGARLFVFGVGFDVNTRLLDTLAEDNRGSSDYVLPQEDIEQKVGALYSKIAYPVLSNPTIDWGGMHVYDVYPKRLPDLFRGMQTVVFGRYHGDNNAHVQLIGTSMGQETRIAGQGNFAAGDHYNDTLPRLWAMRKVGYLLDDSRRAGSPLSDEVKQEVIQLSKRYGIITPLTAGLITEDDGSGLRIESTERPIAAFSSRAPAAPTLSTRVTGGAVTQSYPVGPKGAVGQNGALGPTGQVAARGLYDLDATDGSKAIMAAKATKDLRNTDQAAADNMVRYVEGKAFFYRNGTWFDGAYDPGKSPTPGTVKFGSDEYLALMKDAQVAKWLSVGDRVVLVLKDRVIRVEP